MVVRLPVMALDHPPALMFLIARWLKEAIDPVTQLYRIIAIFSLLVSETTTNLMILVLIICNLICSTGEEHPIQRFNTII